MAYTTATAVQTLLGPNYGPNPDGTSPDLQPYIDSAHNVVLLAQTAAANKPLPYIHLTSELELIERWLAAHFYTKMDPVFSSKSTGGASASFVRGQEAEPYKDGAINMDASGMVKAQLNRQTAGGAWIGKPPSAQIPYNQRD